MLFLAALTVAMLLVIWFQTDAFVQYTHLFKKILPKFLTDKIFHLDEYYSVRSSYYSSSVIELTIPTYPEFMSSFYGSTFLGELVSCQFCIATWFSIIISLLFGSFLSFLAIAFLGLCFYKLFLKI